MSKWISRKLFVALVGIVAIVYGIHSGDPEAEAAVSEKGMLMADAAVTLIGIVYMLVQGAIDKKK